MALALEGSEVFRDIGFETLLHVFPVFIWMNVVIVLPVIMVSQQKEISANFTHEDQSSGSLLSLRNLFCCVKFELS